VKWLAFVFGWWVYRPHSAFVAFVLRVKGVRVGKKFYIQGVPYLKIRGHASDIMIGDNVSIYGDVDIRNREAGKIIIDDNVSLDTSCRLVSANQATLHLRPGCHVGGYTIFNCGTDVTVGENTLIAAFCYVQSSNHGIARGTPIMSQPHTYGPIHIGRDAWLGGHVTVLPGVTIGSGAVIGAKAVVTDDVPADSIAVGVPARVLGTRC
jgi:acetyltransferase-like isoleucine patch superfamily enzyme